MLRGRRTKSWLTLAAGVVIGLAIGGGLALGLIIGVRSTPPPDGVLAELKLKAMASHGSETFAIATGPVDDDVEGLFTLDFLTGDLSCVVINGRNGAIGGMFKTNVASVMGAEKGKKPSYLMVTGQIGSVGNYGGQRPAGCLCYVVDANSGDVAAFSFPWAKAATSAGVTQATEMRVVQKWKVRNIAGQ
jgi:hypothetical protein